MTTRRRPRRSELQEILRPARVPLHATDRRLARAASIADLRRLARRRAPRAVFDYTDGAAGEELSLSRSREAYSRVEFSPRVLQDVSGVDTSTTILGRPSAAPWAFAPPGSPGMRTEGELPLVEWLRGRVPVRLVDDGHDVDRAARHRRSRRASMVQLYLWRDRGASRDFSCGRWPRATSTARAVALCRHAARRATWIGTNACGEETHLPTEWRRHRSAGGAARCDSGSRATGNWCG